MAMKQPDDRSHFLLPDLGEGVAEAELITWKVKPGEAVAEHQTLAEMETDKALVEVPSPWSGTIKDLNGSAGDIIQVGAILVTYDIGSGDPAPQPAADTQSSAAPPAEREDAGTVVGNVSESLSMPESFSRARETPTTDASASRALATPAVRRIARDLEIDINTVSGSGRGGRVTASDVQAHADKPAAPAPATRPQTPAAPASDPDVAIATRVAMPIEGVAERIPFRGIRRKTAQALQHSVQTTVHFTVVDEADVTELERRRSGYEELLGRRMSLLPFIMSAVCKALRAHPAINSTVDDFVEEIQIRSVVNLGCAVDTDHGLMVPVIKDADELSVVQMGEQIAELARGCKDRSIDRELLSGGTFTVSNVGSYGGMFATPIINYPEVAILGVGRAKERVLTRNGAFYAGMVLPLSLSCDHRIVDGAEGARFLNTIVSHLEAPEKFLPAV
ncbi:MAG: dihydrolipoamide acetyltransferase family protein [Phycisphaerales bacterium]|jgi:pyruvate dehydrogenase E2 component (dihydrolipoamide acetyltransferase)|nr:dihydrolipoamide acetyltransferase family protein [Phycisphaerales bacterium]